MHKLKLEIDALQVETFLTAAAEARAGTVDAQSFITYGEPNVCGSEATPNCVDTTNDVHIATCGVSCVEMCFETGPNCVD